MIGMVTTRLVASALILATTLAGCGREIRGQAVAAESAPTGSSTSRPGSSAVEDCTSVQAPMTVIETGESEPRLSIPQPTNWKRNSKFDGEIIRFGMVDAELVADQFAPNAVVTLESVDANGVEPQQVLELQRKSVRTGGAVDLRFDPTTVCGLPAERATYTLPPRGDISERSAKFLSVAVRYGERMYSVTVTVQTADPENPTYVTDSSAILDGFQVRAPR